MARKNVWQMGRGEVSERLVLAVRQGRLVDDAKGKALGYAKAVKRWNAGRKGPTDTQERSCRQLLYEVMRFAPDDDYVIDHGDAPLIDREDKPVTVSPRPTNTREAWNPELWK